MDNGYDFYSMGIRYAKEQLIDLKRKAETIGEKYGLDAKIEFETGVCTAIPAYSNIPEIPISEREMKNATIRFAQNNMMNNSYIGGKGISKRV